ncbi:MAG: ABC transporter permease subunit [Clostridia bacterium]|nr:ABC transporter permease subunit [Clostridia bacterium]
MKRLLKWVAILGIVLPLVIVAVWSIYSNWRWPDLTPSDFSLRGYEYAFGPSGHAGPILLRSIGLSLLVTVVTLLVCFPAARALTFYEFRGKRLLNSAVMLPAIVPVLSVALGIHITFLRAGLAGTVLGVLLIQVLPGIPYAVRLLSESFVLNGNRYEPQARTLGATGWKALWHVTIPMNATGLATAGSMVYIVSFSQYFITLLIGGGKVTTFPLLMLPFVQNSDRTIASAMAVIFLVSLWLVVFLLERFLLHYYQRVRAITL